ncbi:LysR family transcriptional regulator [Eggerthella sp. YY7918]|uniref:LysR family transcriptional regulator n=1 Tax=Eggerthella sp. (strain YY7918) TaxID=502558 RepID=UPI0002170F73|nr:LysR family transcriptional regulator [Eggerthella sp. YY7918]BAK43296.1 hypothetical protein EGYY_00110 [Eggerthella sp. YY7918]
MNIKQVKYFISVADEKSFSAAARKQGVSVQAMSKAIKDLERELSTPLLTRDSDGVHLTHFGEALYPKALTTWEAFHELEKMAGAGETYFPVRLSLCSPSFSHNARARAALGAFISKHLGVDVEVTMCSGEDGLEELRKGSLDALITIGTLDRPGFDCWTMGTVFPGVCMAKNHPLAKNETVTLEELSPYVAISSEVYDHFNESILVMYQKDGLEMEVVEPGAHEILPMVDLFYRRHGVCFMANVPALGEMFPASKMIPIAKEDAKAIPLCLISVHQHKTKAYMHLEQLLSDKVVT